MSEKRSKNEFYTGNSQITSRVYGIRLKEGKIHFVEERSGFITTKCLRDQNEDTIRRAFYVLAKLKLEEFKKMYYILAQNDAKYFKMANEVLTSIKAEYEF